MKPGTLHFVEHTVHEGRPVPSQAELSKTRSILQKNAQAKRRRDAIRRLRTTVAHRNIALRPASSTGETTPASSEPELVRRSPSPVQHLGNGRLDPFDALAVSTNPEMQSLLDFWLTLVPGFRDGLNPDDAHRDTALRQCIKFEPTLRAICYAAMLTNTALVHGGTVVSKGVDAIQSSSRVLSYKYQAIKAINELLTRPISKEEFELVAYGLNLFIFAEAAFKDLNGMTTHIRGLKRWAEAFGGTHAIPIHVHLDVSLLSNKAAACGGGKPEFPPPPVPSGPSEGYSSALADFLSEDIHSWLVRPSDSHYNDIRAELQGAWTDMLKLANYIQLRSARPQSVSPSDALYFKRLGLDVDYRLLTYCFEARTFSRKWDAVSESCLIASLLLLNVKLFLASTDSAAVLEPLKRLQSRIQMQYVGTIDPSARDTMLWVLFAGAACGEGSPSLRYYFLRLILDIVVQFQMQSWAEVSAYLQRNLWIDNIMLAPYEQIYLESLSLYEPSGSTSNLTGHDKELAPGVDIKGLPVLGEFDLFA